MYPLAQERLLESGRNGYSSQAEYALPPHPLDRTIILCITPTAFAPLDNADRPLWSSFWVSQTPRAQPTTSTRRDRCLEVSDTISVEQ